MKGLFVLLLILAFFYVFYCGAMSIWSYLALSDIVERAVLEHGKVAGPVRNYIVRGAAESGVPIQERNIVVTSDERSLSVNLRWSFPVVKYHGEDVLEIPLSLERGFAR